jgi:hypothetical protein
MRKKTSSMDSLRSTRLLKVPTNLLQLNSEVKVKKTESSVKENFLLLLVSRIDTPATTQWPSVIQEQ